MRPSASNARDSDRQVTDRSRREVVLLGAGAVGLTGVLAACGGGSDQATGGAPAAPSSAAGGGGGGGALAETKDIPVGGGKIFTAQKVVVTQPEKGTFKAFSAVCTHQGCTVGSINGDIIQCPCHGSQYSIVDGSVQGGPAPKPLPPEKITVTGGEISLA